MPRLPILRVSEPPEGFIYLPSFISAEEEVSLLKQIIHLPFKHFVMGDYVANREVVYYGFDYSTKDGVKKVEAIPHWLDELRTKCAELAKVDVAQFEQAMVAFYPSKATVGWHKDAPQFGSAIAGVSLSSHGKMRFRLMKKDKEELYTVKLEPRSAYLISGKARSVWQHSIAPVSEARYSVTFRTLKVKDNGDEWSI